jgi:hypothetical protein
MRLREGRKDGATQKRREEAIFSEIREGRTETAAGGSGQQGGSREDPQLLLVKEMSWPQGTELTQATHRCPPPAASHHLSWEHRALGNAEIFK